MTTKPSLAGSLIMMIVALALGLASGLLISHMARTRWQTVDARENEAREPVDSGNAIPQGRITAPPPVLPQIGRR